MIHKRRMDFKEAIKVFEKAHEIQVCFFPKKNKLIFQKYFLFKQ